MRLPLRSVALYTYNSSRPEHTARVVSHQAPFDLVSYWLALVDFLLNTSIPSAPTHSLYKMYHNSKQFQWKWRFKIILLFSNISNRLTRPFCSDVVHTLLLLGFQTSLNIIIFAFIYSMSISLCTLSMNNSLNCDSFD